MKYYHQKKGVLTFKRKSYQRIGNKIVDIYVDEKGKEHKLDGTEIAYSEYLKKIRKEKNNDKLVKKLEAKDKKIQALIEKQKKESEAKTLDAVGQLGKEIRESLMAVKNENATADKVRLLLDMEKVKGDKGDDGYTPVKGDDYFTAEEIKDFKTEITPIKGTDYFTNKEISSFKQNVTPVKGVDYYTYDEKEELIKECTPQKGLDYFTKFEAKEFLKLSTPKKGKDYFDGKDGKDGKDGLKGEKGNKPKHKWKGSKLSFELPSGKWGKAVDLRGERGLGGMNAGGSGGGGIKAIKDAGDTEINTKSISNGQALIWDSSIEKWKPGVVASSGGTWGSITGTLSDQTDLQDALDLKADTSSLTDYLKKDGSVALTGDWDIGDGRKIQGDEISARDGAGLKLYDDGGNGIFVEDGGNVGIGTTSPDELLHVVGSTNPEIIVEDSTNNVISRMYATDTIGFFGTKSNHQLNIQTNNSTRMVVTTDGNVGIGTASPSEKLDVDSGNIQLGAIGAASYIDFQGWGDKINVTSAGIDFYSGASQKFYLDVNENQTSTYFAFYNHDTSPTEMVRITEGGNVGIGTTAPDGLLDIVGGATTNNARVKVSASAGNTFLNIYKANTAKTAETRLYSGVEGSEVLKWAYGISDSSSAGSGDEFFIGQAAGGAGANLWIETNGNVGIGTTSPNYKLDINGEFAFRERSSDPSDPPEGSATIWMSDGTSTGSDGDILLKVTAGGTTKTLTIMDFSIL